ncbi:MAG: hypothetical protein OCD76_25695, partial [Reichenbachiella sp.]
MMRLRGWALTVIILCMTMVSYGQNDSLYTTIFIIKSIPASTPPDASLYLSGEFCEWYPDIEAYRFDENPDGSYSVSVQHNKKRFNYKVTRGTWDAVEARKNGRAFPNREYRLRNQNEIVYIHVNAWEDISVGSYNIYMYIMLLCAIQGVLLMVAINTLKKRNRVANSTLGVMLLFISMSLIGRASTFNPEVFNWEPKLIFVPELFLFLFGPIFLLYIHQLLRVKRAKLFLIYFVPVLILFVIFFPYVQLEGQTLKYKIIDHELKLLFAYIGAGAFLFNLYFLFRARQIIRQYQYVGGLNEKQLKYVNFLNSILLVIGSYLVLWLGIILLYISNNFIHYNLTPYVEHLVDVLWMVFSFIVFALGYFAIKNPEILLLNKKYKDQSLESKEIDTVVNSLKRLLDEDLIYRDSELTLTGLANMV